MTRASQRPRWRAAALGLLVAVTLAACATSGPATTGREPESTSTPSPAPQPAPDATTMPDPGTGPAPVRTGAPRPEWLGTRVLPIAPDGFGERLPTPPELVDRRLHTPLLSDPAPAPPDGDHFRADIGPVPEGVLARSTWRPDCPVAVDELRYVTATHVGFDGLVHTGELIVHADVADDVVTVLEALHVARFPIEELRVIAATELDMPPTGDGNVTSAFVCRPAVGSTRWSEHAFGRAIDVNPFHNPYVRGDLIIPELAGAYTDRTTLRPGMVVAGDVVTGTFAAVGWSWGGDWTGPATDPMHFSVSGR